MNQITLPAADLKQALRGLNKVISRKAALPGLQSVRITRNQDGLMTMSATDLDAFVAYHLEQPQPGKPLDILLPFEQLKNVGKASDVVVVMESKDSARMKYFVAGSELNQSVALLPVDEYPPLPKITESASKLPNNFGESLRQAFEMSCSDSSRYVLQGAYLDVSDPNCHSIVATNGSVLFLANTFTFDFKQSVNVAKHRFLEWPGFWEDECSMAVQPAKHGSGYVQFITSRWSCITKQIDGQFPNWKQVVPTDTDNWTRMEVSEPAVKQILSLSTKLPGNDLPCRAIYLRLGKDLIVEAKGKDDKDFTSATIPEVKIIGKPVITAINRLYLQTALKCGLDEIRVNDDHSPIVFLKGGKRMVVMPVQPDKEAPAPATSDTEKPSSPEPETERKPAISKPPAKPEPKKPIDQSVSLTDRIELLKDACKIVIRDLNTLMDAVKQAEKDQRASEKEVETARATLKKLQQVTI